MSSTSQPISLWQSATTPQLEQLLQGWDALVGGLRALRFAHNKPVAFIEIRYRSVAGSASETWRYDETGDDTAEAHATGLKEQAVR